MSARRPRILHLPDARSVSHRIRAFVVNSLCALAPACLAAASLGGCSAPESTMARASTEPGAGPVIEPASGEGARWVSIGLHAGERGEVLAGRISILAPPFLASRTVLIRGHDAGGALLFEQAAMARPTGARVARNHRESVVAFSLPLPEAPGLASITATCPARAADD